MVVDYYKLLCISSDASNKEILSAYRKAALKCHPDKNPDKPEAKELFHNLSKALSVLINENARKQHDQHIRAAQLVKLRNEKLDSCRKWFKDKLETKEKEFAKAKQNESEIATTFPQNKRTNEADDIEILRKNAADILAREQEKLKTKIQKMQSHSPASTGSAPLYAFKLKCSASWIQTHSTGEVEEKISRLFGRFGTLSKVVVKSSVLVCFSSLKVPISQILSFQADDENEVPIKSISLLHSNKENGSDCKEDATQQYRSQSSENKFSHQNKNLEDLENSILARCKAFQSRKEASQTSASRNEDPENVGEEVSNNRMRSFHTSSESNQAFVSVDERLKREEERRKIILEMMKEEGQAS